MSTSQSNAALPLSIPYRIPGREPGVYRIDLPDEGEVMYVIIDRWQRRTRVFLPAELATVETEQIMERWRLDVASAERYRHAPPAAPSIPALCRVLPFPSPPDVSAP